MRIIFLSYNYSSDIHSPNEWIERLKFYTGWSECLAKDHTVIRIDQINYQGVFTHNGIQYHCVDSGKKNNYLPWKLHQMLRNLKPDLVIVSSFMFPLQVIQLRISLPGNVRIMVQHHAEKPFSGIKKYFQYFASRRIDLYLFASKETGISWVKRKNLASEKKIRELPEVSSDFHPVDKISAREITKVTGSPAFIWVGRLNQNKDPVTAVKSFLRFAQWQPQARLYLIFQTDELIDEINALLSGYLPGCPVALIGKIEHKDLLYWFNSMDFYLSASHYEGSGTALCEAMSCGCIPVVTAIPSFRSMITDCGLFYEAGNAEDLLSALKQTGNLQLDEKKQNVLHRFESELSFNAIAAKFQQILDSLN